MRTVRVLLRGRGANAAPAAGGEAERACAGLGRAGRQTPAHLRGDRGEANPKGPRDSHAIRTDGRDRGKTPYRRATPSPSRGSSRGATLSRRSPRTASARSSAIRPAGRTRRSAPSRSARWTKRRASPSSIGRRRAGRWRMPKRPGSARLSQPCPGPCFLHCASGRRSGALTITHVATEEGLTGDETLRKADAPGLRCGPPELERVVRSYVDRHGGLTGLSLRPARARARAAGPPR